MAARYLVKAVPWIGKHGENEPVAASQADLMDMGKDLLIRR
jgi:hypothetical protein